MWRTKTHLVSINPARTTESRRPTLLLYFYTMAPGCTLREWLGEGPFSLALSSSWLGLFCHAGVVCALVESGFSPTKLAGSSAGALVAVLWAATMDTRRLRETMERAEARNPIIWASLFSRNVLPGVVNIHRSTHELLDRILDGQTPPDLDEGATPVIVSAFDPTRLKTRVFSDGKAAEALAASMAVPVLFKPVWSNGRPLIDGAVGDVAGVDGLERSDRVLYHHATYLPLWLTQHLAGFSDLVALKIHGLPYLNPWQLQGNGMDAFRLAKEATLRALDCPMTATRWSAGEVARKADTENSGSGSNSSGGGSRAGIGGFSPSSEVGNQGVRLVEVRTRRHRGTGDDDGGVRSRL